jgi:hypothetical protein
MATFNDQLKNNRLKISSLDVLNHASGIGQQWDTYGVAISDIIAPNFWDGSRRPRETNDVVAVTLHDSTDDGGRMGSFRALTGSARRLEDDHSASQLIKLGCGDDFCTFDIEDIGQYGEKIVTFPLRYHGTLRPVMFYVFIDGERIKGGRIVLKSGSTTLATVTLGAGDSYGKMYSYDASSNGPASTDTITFTGIAREISRGNIPAVMVRNYELPASE